MRSYYNDFNSDDVLLEFYPPTRESWQYEQICFSVKDSCQYEKRNIFRIPSHINLTRDEVIQACEQGEVSPYRYSDDDVFKNVFCAICNSRASSIDGSVTCGVQKDPEEAIKGARGSFASLIDHKYIDSKLERKKRNKNFNLACLPTNANSTTETQLCREVLCPALQIRSDDGTCFYPMDKFFATKLEISLNLTSAERIDTSKLQNMSKTEINEVFKRTMPWPKSWEIVLVMLRIDTNSSEFVMVVGYRNFAFLNMRKFRRLLEVILSRPWPVDIGQTYAFNQSFDVHGIPLKVDGPRKDALYGKPRWTKLADTNEMIANLSSPTWQVLLWNSNVFYYDPPGEPLEITNIFLCDQIELYDDEFIGILNAYPALIKHNEKFVYPRQYYMYNGENGSQVINVCLEDSDFDLMPDNNAAPRLKMMFKSLLLFMLLYVMILVMFYLY